MIRKLLIATTLTATLCACGGKSNEGDSASEGGGARGEVLGGTISDDMIPLDQLKSRSAPQNASPTASTTGGSEAAPAAAPAEAADPAAEPASTADDTDPELPED